MTMGSRLTLQLRRLTCGLVMERDIDLHLDLSLETFFFFHIAQPILKYRLANKVPHMPSSKLAWVQIQTPFLPNSVTSSELLNSLFPRLRGRKQQDPQGELTDIEDTQQSPGCCRWHHIKMFSYW